MDLKFSKNWFNDVAPQNWDQIFDWYVNQSGRKITSALEIGCFEGQATCYMAENWLAKVCEYDVVDTFGGSEEEDGMADVMDNLEQSDFIYDNFIHNISHYPDTNFRVHRGESQLIVPKLYEDGETYDFIYIDASHLADDTFVDGYYAWKMLREGGIMIFDDFKWKDPNRHGHNDSPELGIKAFLMMNEGDYSIIMDGYQLGLLKQKPNEQEK